MNTITDYILWRGDLSFQSSPFQVLDAVVLSQITYFDMIPYFAEKKTGTIAEIYDFLSAKDHLDCKIVGFDNHSKKLFEAAASSKRYGDILVEKYMDIVNPEYALQFSAMTYHIEKDETGKAIRYVSYRGTDSTLAGWKEDCMTMFRKTDAQDLALDYFKSTLFYGDHENCRYLVGGHSKGANLAMYAASMVPEDLQAYIDHVYVFDGPGFCPEVLDLEKLRHIDDKMTRLIPEYCIVGRLFDSEITDTTVVKSVALRLLQHNMSTWCVDYIRPFEAEGTSPVSDFLSNSLMEWVNDISLQEREEMVEQFFTLLSEDGDNRNWGLNLSAVRTSLEEGLKELREKRRIEYHKNK